MGRTPKPLRIAVTDEQLARHPKFEPLRAQGHVVMSIVDFINEVRDGQPWANVPWDFIIGPQAWYATEAHVDQYLDSIIAHARKLAYPKGE